MKSCIMCCAFAIIYVAMLHVPCFSQCQSSLVLTPIDVIWQSIINLTSSFLSFCSSFTFPWFRQRSCEIDENNTKRDALGIRNDFLSHWITISISFKSKVRLLYGLALSLLTLFINCNFNFTSWEFQRWVSHQQVTNTCHLLFLYLIHIYSLSF